MVYSSLQLYIILLALFAASATAADYAQLRERHRISAQPAVTKSPWYISPADAEPRFARAATHEDHEDDYTSPFSSDLDAYFADSRAKQRHRSGALNDRRRPAKLTEADTEDDDFRSIPSNRQTEGDGDDTPDAYHYDQQFHDDEYARIRTASKQQEQEIVAHNPKLCKISVKNGMECSVCKNPKTGSHSEQCSFSSSAPEKKYAYTKERNYNSRDEDDENEEAGSEEEEPVRKPQPKKIVKKLVKKTSSPKPTSRRSQPLRNAPNSDSPWRPILAPLRFRSSYAAQASEQHASVVAVEPLLFGIRANEALTKHRKRDTNEDEDNDDGFSFERFFARDFPEAKNAGLIRVDDDGADASEADKLSAETFRPDYGGKRSVERVLADFKQRDWSQCERRQRHSLTCYVCHDEHGVRHEECMFVAGGDEADAVSSSKPKSSSHLAYTETKEYHSDGDDDEEEGEGEAVPTKQSKTKTKSARLETEADDNIHQKQQSRRSRTTKRKVEVMKRATKPDVGVHQASSGQRLRSIKRRQNSDEAIVTGLEQPHLAYAHEVRH